MVERFEGKYVPIPESGCWIWEGTCYPNRYGQFMVRENGKAKAKLAHRMSWTIYRGQIPLGMQVLHRCDTPECVNPNHLFLGTISENMKDCAQKGRNFSFFQNVTACINEHAFTEENTKMKKNKKGWYRACKECMRIQARKRSKGH